jgi:hypothetical protein
METALQSPRHTLKTIKINSLDKTKRRHAPTQSTFVTTKSRGAPF